MKSEEQVTNLELSRKLKELGVKQESLWWWIKNETSKDNKFGLANRELKNERIRFYSNCSLKFEFFPAFTVAELGEMLPDEIYNGAILTWKFENEYFCSCKADETIPTFEDKTEANARAKMLIYLLKNGLINKRL